MTDYLSEYRRFGFSYSKKECLAHDSHLNNLTKEGCCSMCGTMPSPNEEAIVVTITIKRK